MVVFFSETGSLNDLKVNLEKADAIPEIQSIFILACDKNNFTPDNCDSIIKKVRKPLWGGIFPGIIHNNQKLEKGTIIIGFKKEVSLQVIPNLSDNNQEFESILAKRIDDSHIYPTMAILVDGFSKRINELIESLFLIFGLDYNYIGGGAGSLSMVQKPCIFTNIGLLKDCAIIAGLKMICGVGVQHGWTSISGPFKVTSSEKNVIKTIDYKPAFEIYKEVVEQHSGKQFNERNFFEIAKAYPFGINKLGAEKVVRDPLSIENGSLICVGELSEGSFVDILHGNNESLVKAATIAADRSASFVKPEDRNFDLLFDCISRVLFLEDNFESELKAVKTPNIPIYGALSIGEIANNKRDYLEFYNKTVVVASFSKCDC